MKKTIFKGLSVLAVAALFTACAESVVADFQVPAPEGTAELEKLYSYEPIKSYVDHTKYPNFKIGVAVTASDYNEGGTSRAVATTNFDEIVLVNAMKMGSTVKDDGSMNFKPVKDVLEGAEAAELSVFGNSLAMHTTQPVNYLNTVIADVKPEHTPENLSTDVDLDFSTLADGTVPFPEVTKGFSPKVVGGVLSAPYPKKKYSYYISPVIETQAGVQYEISFVCRGDLKEKISVSFGGNTKQFAPDTDWTEFVFKLNASEDSEGVIIDAGRYKGTIEYKNVKLTHYPERKQTPEEKSANLANALGEWYGALFETCAGRVTAWNVINEPLANEGEVTLNGKVCYDLQHAADNAKDFYWQDYFGSEQYGAIVSKVARDAWAAAGGNAGDLKLFVNESNLENPEDDNQKLASLIEWIKVWEANGAKIDGIASQMHTTFSENMEWQKARADHYVKMLHMMAETGKIVRISELDMNYQNINAAEMTSGGLNTTVMNEQQFQNMANYYRFIIQMYLKIVPPAQQYGICQWSINDNGSKPLGLWTKEWERKAAYIGFCEALSQPIPETEDYFDFLSKAGLSHYVSPVEE